MRNIPATMATQHPDNAGAPFWDESTPFINVYKEFNEALASMQQLGVSECMWDWEGKHADAAIIDRLFSDYHDYFSHTQLGRDKFLTFRIPNIWEEKGYNLMQAMTAILSSEDFARDLAFENRPLFEVILPMTERADQVMSMQQLFQKLADFKSNDFTPDEPANYNHLELIPLVESVESQQGVANLLREYIVLHDKHFGYKPEYLRVFLACSDPAEDAGHLATVFANKIAISDLAQFSEETGIPVFPIAGPGSLPFRGGLSPATVEHYMAEFPGIRTVTVQSSFRYDHPKAHVIAAIATLETKLAHTTPMIFDDVTRAALVTISAIAEKYYKESLSGIVADMQPVFKAFPKRRDRRQHIGLLAYGRTVGEQQLPRAITFTGSFYSIGVPPELIGLGRALRDLDAGQLQLVRSHYTNFIKNITFAGRYLSKQSLAALAAKNPAWHGIEQDVEAVETLLEIPVGPTDDDQKQHCALSEKFTVPTITKEDMTVVIETQARLRKSLG